MVCVCLWRCLQVFGNNLCGRSSGYKSRNVAWEGCVGVVGIRNVQFVIRIS